MLKPEKFADKRARESGAAVSRRPFDVKNGKNGAFSQTADNQQFAILLVLRRKFGQTKVEVWAAQTHTLGSPNCQKGTGQGRGQHRRG